jgi:hypothetical protein
VPMQLDALTTHRLDLLSTWWHKNLPIYVYEAVRCALIQQKVFLHTCAFKSGMYTYRYFFEYKLKVAAVACTETQTKSIMVDNYSVILHGFRVNASPQEVEEFQISRHQIQKNHRHIDWCCFYYIVRNSLVSLLEALCARNIHNFLYLHDDDNCFLYYK